VSATSRIAKLGPVPRPTIAVVARSARQAAAAADTSAVPSAEPDLRQQSKPHYTDGATQRGGPSSFLTHRQLAQRA
jgi:hypothetical protein